ncbi:MAG: glycosyltransferase family 4 protein [Patescibacteria group bacterium]|jgi:glycosyltransferase involved in cell wall biosynthesis
MKIAFIGQKGIPANNGGVEKYVESLAVNLVALNQEVLVYNRQDYLPDQLKEFKGIKIVNISYFNSKNLANITQTFLAILDVLKRRVDIVHFQGVGPSLLCWLPKLFNPRLKIVATLHSFDYYNDKWSWFAKKMLQLGEHLMCRYADQVIVLSVFMKNYVKTKYNCEATLIPGGADLYTALDQDCLSTWSLSRGNYILSVSRIIKLKGLQYLISAFKNLKTTKKLVIVGEGEYLAVLKELAASDDRIIFTGNQNGRTLDQLYANAYIFVQPSEMEGLSISLLEAMAHRNACLVSDIEANREALAGTGFTFETKNTADLQKQLEKLLIDQEEVEIKAAAAYERARQNFTWVGVAERILKFYQNLLAITANNK